MLGVEFMEQLIYPFLISFIMIFIAELGDKTQLIVLSFSNTLKARTILFGVALGSLFSHGIAIIFGSSLGLLNNSFLRQLLEIITYTSFILMGIFSLLPKKEKISFDDNKKSGLLQKISNLKLNYCLIIALNIMLGELGDKTFLASIGFGLQYPNSKIMLVLGAVLGMVASNSIAIIFGKILNKYISETTFQRLSGILFLIFGMVGFLFN